MKDFKEKLIEEANKYNLNITFEMAERFEKYKDLLLKWNEVMNLTAITEEDEIIVKHFIDSLICTRYITNEKNLIDIGTGAGFPGIPLAIYYLNNKKVVLLDSLNKRINFLNDVVENLNLNNVKCIHARAEEYAQKAEYREKYDLVVSRAVAPLNILAEFNTPYINLYGKAIFMKGSNYKEELENSQKAFKTLNMEIQTTEEYLLNDEITHSIIIAKKIDNTPNKYPRIYGKIKKMPL